MRRPKLIELIEGYDQDKQKQILKYMIEKRITISGSGTEKQIDLDKISALKYSKLVRYAVSLNVEIKEKLQM